MPDYNLVSPDGQKYKLTVPEGATQDQITKNANAAIAAITSRGGAQPDSTLKGVGEAALHGATALTTGMAAPVAGGLTGLGTLVGGLASGEGLDSALAKATRDIRGTEQAVGPYATYEPKTPTGKKLGEYVDVGLGFPQKVGGVVGEAVRRGTEQVPVIGPAVAPIAATAADVVTQTIPYALGAKALGKLLPGRGVEAEVPTEPTAPQPPSPAPKQAVKPVSGSSVWPTEASDIKAAPDVERYVADPVTGEVTKQPSPSGTGSGAAGALAAGAPRQRPAGEAKAAPKEGIKFVITNADKAALRAAGYSDEAISNMRPEDAQKALASKAEAPAEKKWPDTTYHRPDGFAWTPLRAGAVDPETAAEYGVSQGRVFDVRRKGPGENRQFLNVQELPSGEWQVQDNSPQRRPISTHATMEDAAVAAEKAHRALYKQTKAGKPKVEKPVGPATSSEITQLKKRLKREKYPPELIEKIVAKAKGEEAPAAEPVKPAKPSILKSQRGAAGNIGSAEKAKAAATHVTEQWTTSSQGAVSTEELPQRAGNIRLDLVETTDDAKRVILEASQQNHGFTTERRGVISKEEMRRLADEMGVKASDITKRRKGEAWNVEQILGARDVLWQSAPKLAELAAKYINGGKSEYDLVAFQRALQQHEMVQGQVAGMTAEWGRAGHAFQLQPKTGAKAIPGVAPRVSPAPAEMAPGQAAAIRVILERFGGKERLETIAEHIAGLDTPSKINRYTRKAGTTPQSRLFRLYLNSLLSNPVTWAVKFMSDAAMNVWNIADTAFAGTIGAVKGSADRPYVQEAAAQAQGLVGGFHDAIVAAGHMIRYGESKPVYRMGFEDPFTSAARTMMTGKQVFGGLGVLDEPSPTGRSILDVGMPGEPIRILKTIDEFWKNIAYRQAIHTQLLRDGLHNGLKGRDLQEFINDRMTNVPDEVASAAEQQMHYLTQTRKLGPKAQAINRIVSVTPGLRYVVPFRRVPINLVKTAIEHSPVGMLSSEVRAMVEKGGATRDLAYARMATGTAAMMWSVFHAVNDNITGGGPADPRKRATWALTHKPYSIKVGNEWISYQRIEPIAFLLGTAADYVEMSSHKEIEDKDLVTAVANIGYVLGRDLASRTYLRTIAELAEALGGGGSAMRRFVATLASSPIPAGLAQAGRVTDPMQRDVSAGARAEPDAMHQYARAVLDAIKAKVPVWREQLPVRRNVLGEPQKEEGAWPSGTSMVSPFYRSEIPDANIAVRGPIQGGPPPVSVEAELNKLNISLNYPREEVRIQGANYKMPVELYEKIHELRGKIIKEQVGKMIASPTYERWPIEVKREMVKKIIAGSRKAATGLLQKDIFTALKNEITKPKQSTVEGKPVEANL